jgi:hypothetical protein
LEKSISQKIKAWEFKEVSIGSQSYLVGNQPQKLSAPHSMEIITFKHQSLFVFGCFLLWTSLLKNNEN